MLQAEAGLRLTSPPEPPSPGPEAGAKTPSPRLWASGTVVTGNVRGWTRLQQRGPRGHGGSEAVHPPAPWLHTGRVPEGKSRAQRPTRLFGVWVPRTGQTGAVAARVRPPVQPRAFPGAHLSPRARPGRLAWLGGFPQGEVIGGPLLTQAVCRDAQVTCGHEEAGHPVLPGGQNCVTARPPLGATGQHFKFPLTSLVSPRLHYDRVSVPPQNIVYETTYKLRLPGPEPHLPVPRTALSPTPPAATARVGVSHGARG